MSEENVCQTLLPEDAKQLKLVEDFQKLLEHSKLLFNALRELPQYGQHLWQPHFAKTFESYTMLWKFQQENRVALNRGFNLQRWQIGDIASKIGQLYYQYYLRTSDRNYLNEAYQFYSAIRTRKYYKVTDLEKNTDVLVRKHRYYARFIVVCLLLNYRQDLISLIEELSHHVEEYKSVLPDNEDTEWEDVVKEIEQFPDVDPVEVLHSETYQRCYPSIRMSSTSLPPCDSGFKSVLTLGDAIIVGNSPSQMKFSELTIDMLRFINVIEKGPKSINSCFIKPSQEKQINLSKRSNLHKNLLYRPNIYELLTCISTAIKELQPSQALLIYISADGRSPKNKNSTNQDNHGYTGDGILTNDNVPIGRAARQSLHDINCLQPADLYPFARKPLLIIIDSDYASVFSNFPDLFGQPVVCLMAPKESPGSIKSQGTTGVELIPPKDINGRYFFQKLASSNNEAIFQPISKPAFPDDFFRSIVIQRKISELSGLLGVKGIFSDS